MPIVVNLPLRVLIVDDHEIMRAGLRTLLGGLRWLQVIAEAGDGGAAIELAERLRPDLILLDVRMAGIDGCQVLRHLAWQPLTRDIVVISLHDSLEHVREARSAGAQAYVFKDATRAELLGAIQRAWRERPLAKGVRAGEAAHFPIDERLTEREGQVLALLAQGLTNRQIGDRLGIACGTAKTHVEHILAKLGVCHRTQAAVRSAALGLTPPPRHPDAPDAGFRARALTVPGSA
ncbi:response regulator [Lysobacter sp. cf310]|uniref:response regulator n=1 Tax=Lysobacter sp. cf310 TaxID=1761790 RepID=UPI0008F0D74E|nr:response regulator transcription factor [Lysobacter sp. cf310]SFK82525.1 DNA-binding response regulator, NarL/FixJ family, contains REC and HTH domains [Lysobacter sp. cf310]